MIWILNNPRMAKHWTDVLAYYKERWIKGDEETIMFGGKVHLFKKKSKSRRKGK